MTRGHRIPLTFALDPIDSCFGSHWLLHWIPLTFASDPIDFTSDPIDSHFRSHWLSWVKRTKIESNLYLDREFITKQALVSPTDIFFLHAIISMNAAVNEMQGNHFYLVIYDLNVIIVCDLLVDDIKCVKLPLGSHFDQPLVHTLTIRHNDRGGMRHASGQHLNVPHL